MYGEGSKRGRDVVSGGHLAGGEKRAADVHLERLGLMGHRKKDFVKGCTLFYGKRC